MPYDKLTFRFHAVQRMFERDISVDEIRTILKTGEVIEDYPNDKPYPSNLILARVKNRPLHPVAAHYHEKKETIIITVYEPDPEKWDLDFKKRRR
ncbi:MAG: DUF4258 domain-containing protein [Candidatus Omnitrophica bacterium]|nr:DUF4258 domain-containing protein [Candidatus Omnitrophota bacterium]